MADLNDEQSELLAAYLAWIAVEMPALQRVIESALERDYGFKEVGPALKKIRDQLT